ncbi:hypothetical protein MBLNU13_g09648t2 [Cladosporium sp. NU13]
MPLPEDKAVVETGDSLVKTLRGAFAHAKGRLLRGTFTPTSKASSLSSAPHFTAPNTPLLARFSSSTGLPHIPDTDPNANPRGLALRFLLSADEHKHTDIIAHSTPFFPTRTGEGFLAMLRALGDGSIGSFLEATPSAAAFVQAPKPSPVSFATEKYFGVNAFTLVSAEGGRTSVRYRIAPEAGVQTLAEEDVKGKSETYLFDEIPQRLEGSSIEFKLLAQIARAGDPTDDATQHWPGDREVVELGTIELKEILSEEESRKLEKYVIFDPIPRVEGVEASDDPLLDVRAAVYLISGKGRRAAE